VKLYEQIGMALLIPIWVIIRLILFLITLTPLHYAMNSGQIVIQVFTISVYVGILGIFVLEHGKKRNWK
jgi:hypothetical protein